MKPWTIPGVRRLGRVFVVLVPVLGAFYVGIRFERYSHPLCATAKQLGVIRTDTDAAQTIHPILMRGLKLYGESYPLPSFEWKRQTFLEYLFSESPYDDNGSRVLSYDNVKHELCVYRSYQKDCDWIGVLPSHIERVIKEKRAIGDLGNMECKETSP